MKTSIVYVAHGLSEMRLTISLRSIHLKTSEQPWHMMSRRSSGVEHPQTHSGSSPALVFLGSVT